MRKTLNILFLFLFSFYFNYIIAGPGDELKLPNKKNNEKQEPKGKGGFVSLLPTDGDGSLSMRNRGMAIGIDDPSIDAHLKNYTQQYLAKRSRWYTTIQSTPRYQKILQLYDHILPSYGIPKEIKYLSIIESDLQSNAVSIAGATGPWQIMYDEAKSYNLIRGNRDLRTDYEASTHAAAKLIKTLYKRYGDWLLVLSAYNAGIGRVDKAIRQSSSKDFWQVQRYLPNETRHHVRRFIATHYFFEGSGGATTLTASQLAKLKHKTDSKNGNLPLPTGMGILRIKGIYNAATVASFLGISETNFNYNNPDFNTTLASGEEYDMRIPADKIQHFIDNREAILQQGINDLLK